jgi:hypothetical protein
MKKTYGTERGSQGIIINRISEPVTRLAIKLMDFKLLRKCRKEEAHAGVIAVVVQCAKGTLLIWSPYLLNLFLEDYKDAQDLGTEFHYAWMIILIYLVGWGEPKYNRFYPRPGKCRTNEVHNIMAHFKRKREEGKFQHIFYVFG